MSKKLSPVFPLSLTSSDTEGDDQLDQVKLSIKRRLEEISSDSLSMTSSQDFTAKIDFSNLNKVVQNYGKKKVQENAVT